MRHSPGLSHKRNKGPGEGAGTTCCLSDSHNLLRKCSEESRRRDWLRRLEEREQRLELVASTMDEKKRSLLEEDAAAQA